MSCFRFLLRSKTFAATCPALPLKFLRLVRSLAPCNTPEAPPRAADPASAPARSWRVFSAPTVIFPICSSIGLSAPRRSSRPATPAKPAATTSRGTHGAVRRDGRTRARGARGHPLSAAVQADAAVWRCREQPALPQQRQRHTLPIAPYGVLDARPRWGRRDHRCR